MKSFAGKTAAITGAGSGIGRGLALALAQKGCRLSLSDVNETGLAQTVKLVNSASTVDVTSQILDVADREGMHAWADQTAADHGDVHMIFNNAGVALAAGVADASYEDLEWIVNINFWGVVYGTKAFLPLLKASGDGHIINISSVFGLIGVPSQGAYNATKFAVRGFTEALREELEIADEPVSATSVHPGGIKTNIARAARYSSEMQELVGQDAASGATKFEKLFTTTPDSAASTILKGVQRNARRVLIGPDAHAIDIIARLMPSSYQRIIVAGARMALRNKS